MVMRFTSTGGRGGTSRPAARLRLRSSHRGGLGLKVSHRQSTGGWTPPSKDRDLEPTDTGRQGKKNRKR
jgi:hypothetical protein